MKESRYKIGDVELTLGKAFLVVQASEGIISCLLKRLPFYVDATSRRVWYLKEMEATVVRQVAELFDAPPQPEKKVRRVAI